MIDRTKDIRWHRGPGDGERLTYIESLKAELKHRNHWIYPGEWDAIERWLPTISEEDAKEQCFIIRDKIRARVDYDHRRRIVGMDIETGQLVVEGKDGKVYPISKTFTDPLGDEHIFYHSRRDRWIVTHETVEIRS